MKTAQDRSQYPPARQQRPQRAPKQKSKERKLMKISRARKANFLKYIFGIILIGAGIYLYYNNFLGTWNSTISIVVMVIGVLVLILSEIVRLKLRYYITQYRIIEVRGYLRKNKHAVRLDHVSSAETKQNFLNRMFGVGNVILRTSSGERIEIQKIDDPLRLESIIISEMKRGQRHMPPAGDY